MKYIWNFKDENMKKSGASHGQSASELISKRIAELGDWRGETLSRMRKLIKEADPDVVEEWKWRGTPIWSHDGIICTGESYKNVVKLTFAKGASLKDPARAWCRRCSASTSGRTKGNCARRSTDSPSSISGSRAKSPKSRSCWRAIADRISPARLWWWMAGGCWGEGPASWTCLLWTGGPRGYPGLSYAFLRASRTRAGVIGNCRSLTPTASKMALAITAPTVMMGGSPPPTAGMPGLSMRMVSSLGIQEKRGIW